jgi:hypothetical protein
MGGEGAANSHDTVAERDATGATRIAGAWNWSTENAGAISGGVASCWQQHRTVCWHGSDDVFDSAGAFLWQQLRILTVLCAAFAGAQHNPTGEAVSSPATSARIFSAVVVMTMSTQFERFLMG